MNYGTIQSSIGLGRLLWSGIGDTIRVSLSADPVEEVKAGFQILKSLGIRNKGVTIISCPSCARQNFDVISTVKMKNISNRELDAYVSLEDWKDKAGGYGLQGYAAVFVTWIQGSFSSIIGLPLAETSALLSVAGIRVLK